MSEARPQIIRKSPVIARENSTPEPSSPMSVRTKDELIETAKLKLEELLALIVDHPDEVSVSVLQGEKTTVFKVNSSQRNIGKILGSKGKMITSLRNLVLAITARQGIRSVIEVPYYAPDTEV